MTNPNDLPIDVAAELEIQAAIAEAASDLVEPIEPTALDDIAIPTEPAEPTDPAEPAEPAGPAKPKKAKKQRAELPPTEVVVAALERYDAGEDFNAIAKSLGLHWVTLKRGVLQIRPNFNVSDRK